ncbi:MAG: radical SAM protein [Candidatus Lokiarchaeota archaeon]|nr:radical SAM protein [Candidatus Lokiarchaeota archaeon]
MRILLIQPDYPKDYRYGPKGAILFPPLGLECIAGNITDLADVRIFDHRVFDIEKLKREISSYDPNYIGISCNFSTQIYHVNALAKISKEYSNNGKIVLGGWHPTLAPDETLYSPYVDIVVRSEGELTFRELIEKDNPKGVKGLSYKNNNKIIHNDTRKLEDLNLIKSPDRSLRIGKARKRYNFFGIPADCLETSRGCPFRCKFCNVHNFYQHKYRIKNTQKIIKELLEIRKHSRFAYIIDDNFMVFPDHITDLCDAIIDTGLNMLFMTTARVDMVSKHPQIFEKMADAGFIFLFLGIESFSNKTLKNLNKQFEFKEIRNAIKILHDLGFIIQGNIILGANYDDTVADLESTIKIAKTLDLDLPTFSLLTPYPMTELRTEVEDKGILIDREWREYTWFKPMIKYPNLTSEQLEHYIQKAYSELRFFSSPMRRITRITKSRGLPYFIRRFANFKFMKSLIPSVKNMVSRLLTGG